MKQKLETLIAEVILKLFELPEEIELTRTDEQFGDYATNVALKLSKQLNKNPSEIAESITSEINQIPEISKASVAGPGFINIILSDSALISSLAVDVNKINLGKRVLLEYSCPNAFKELHTGHLYQTVVGDALGKMLEATGASVFRANFGGDVGLHVAKCLYGIVQILGGEKPEQLSKVAESKRPEWLSEAYVRGSKSYESDELAKTAIAEINEQVYAFHSMEDHESELAQIYWQCREWSYDYFRTFYENIEVAPFDKYYPESGSIKPGMEAVSANMDKVFKQSESAIIYAGEDAGLHTRVFVTSKGLPTYETKDLGVILSETHDFDYDKRIIMTGNDQSEYMKVVFSALNAIDPALASKQTHLSHGTIRFGTGQKMSSRLGNVTRAIDVVTTTAEMVKADSEADKKQVTLGAIKYSFLKHRIGGDIAFDVNESVSLEGNSGPYLQYAHARARSIIAKADAPAVAEFSTFEAGERLLATKLSEYNEAIQQASNDLMPHIICNYLYELAQSFNRFYENNRVIGTERQEQRLRLVITYAEILKSGLNLLGISAPDKM